VDKLKELTLGEKIIVAAGVVLLIDSFLPWYKIDISIFHFSRNGWQAPNSFLSVVAILLGIAMAAQVLVSRLGTVDMPDRMGSLGWGMVHLIAGGVAFLFVLIKWLNNTDWVAYGLYIGLISTAALAFGGFTVAKERGDLPATRGMGGSAGPGGPTV
jgi:hypothetical protein